MKAYIITAAGLSSRFSDSLGHEALKCIYYEEDPQRSLIGRLLEPAPCFDEVIVVGGYRFQELEAFIAEYMPKEVVENTRVVKNDHYADLASGWSLFVGLQALDLEDFDSVLFAEGDLFVDNAAMGNLAQGSTDAVTISPDPICADKSVALYFNEQGIPRFSYSESHEALKIDEPFLSVHSSGQMWRFSDTARLARVAEDFRLHGGGGTNLKIIGEYFKGANPNEIEKIHFKEWINCNTIDDWRRAFIR